MFMQLLDLFDDLPFQGGFDYYTYTFKLILQLLNAKFVIRRGTLFFYPNSSSLFSLEFRIFVSSFLVSSAGVRVVQ